MIILWQMKRKRTPALCIVSQIPVDQVFSKVALAFAVVDEVVQP